MANPNIGNTTTIIANTVTSNLTTTSTTTLLSGSANSVHKINTIIIANINGVSSASANLSYNDGTTDRFFAYQVVVPAGSSVVVIDKGSGFYVTENASIRGGSSSNNFLTSLISFETLS